MFGKSVSGVHNVDLTRLLFSTKHSFYIATTLVNSAAIKKISMDQGSGKRVVVTGGSGKVGRHVIEFLLAQGHEVLNLDLFNLPEPLSGRVHTLKVDLTDGAQVFSALTSHFHFGEPLAKVTSRVPDAVVHLAGHSRNMIVPDNETFLANVTSTFNILEAACKLGVPKIVLASSVCVYGVTYAEGDKDFPSFPIDEEITSTPTDAYSISKKCMEVMAAGYAARFGNDIYALRIGAVISPEEYQTRFPSYVSEPEKWKVHGWSYTDARDLGKMVHLAILRDGLGYQVFNATNDSITHNPSSTTEYLKRVCPQTPMTRELGHLEAPMSNRKIKELLGFEEDHPWQKYYSL
jgi:nucleoside-diphosphate-sugar epimerase